MGCASSQTVPQTKETVVNAIPTDSDKSHVPVLEDFAEVSTADSRCNQDLPREASDFTACSTSKECQPESVPTARAPAPILCGNGCGRPAADGGRFPNCCRTCRGPHGRHGPNCNACVQTCRWQRVDDRTSLPALQGFLDELGLRIEDAGSVLKTDGMAWQLGHCARPNLRQNCFYLALARSYVGPASEEDVHSTAVKLKGIIETTVKQNNTDYEASGRVGDEVPAEADSLLYAIGDRKSQLSSLAAVIVDGQTGQTSVWKGVRYDDETRGNLQKQATNLLLLSHTRNHYQSLVASDGSKPKLILERVKAVLDQKSIPYYECSGI